MIESAVLKKTLNKKDYLKGTEAHYKSDKSKLISWQKKINEQKVTVDGNDATATENYTITGSEHQGSFLPVTSPVHYHIVALEGSVHPGT